MNVKMDCLCVCDEIKLAQNEVLSKDGSQLVPPGMHVVYLPYADDIRSLQFPNIRKASDEQINKAKEVVKRLRIRFDSLNFENPGLLPFFPPSFSVI